MLFMSQPRKQAPPRRRRSKQSEWFTAPIKVGILPSLLGYNIRRAQIALWRDFSRTVGEGAFRPGMFSLLVLVDANPGITQGRLAQAVGLDRSTMVGVIDALEARGLLGRRRGEDRRTNGLWLTRSGRALLGRLRKRIDLHERRVAARLTAPERAQLVSLLEKLSG